MLFYKIRLTFVCKYKYSQQTSNSLKKKFSVFLINAFRNEAKKNPRERGSKIF